MRPDLLLVAAFSLATSALSAQAVHQKNLLITMGVGAGLVSLKSPTEVLRLDQGQCGAVRIAFGYALSDRWSLGMHYDRIGTTDHPGPVQRFRLTTYLLEGSYRPIIGKRGTVELNAGIGSSVLALTPTNGRLPARSNHGSLAFGLRYVYVISGTIGAYLASDIAAGNEADLAIEGAPVTDEQGRTVRTSWNSQRLGAGLVVRF
jgi:hypothetical protein